MTAYKINSKMDETLEFLRQHYGVESKSDILRKAVALLNIASRSEQPDGSFIIKQDDQDVKIIIK